MFFVIVTIILLNIEWRGVRKRPSFEK
jgi:hypothetical protein